MKGDRPKKDSVEKFVVDFTLSKVDALSNPPFSEINLAFQKAAGSQVDVFGLGPDYSLRTRMIFVLCREKVDVLKPFNKEETYTLVTYPLAPGRIDMTREAYILNNKDEVMLTLTSLWVLLNYDSRRISSTRDVAVAQSHYPLLETITPLYEEKRLPALDREDIHGEIVLRHLVCQEDLDVNNHMNNTIYLKLLEALPFRKAVRGFEINYEKECFLGEEILVERKEEENSTLFAGFKPSGELSFLIRYFY